MSLTADNTEEKISELTDVTTETKKDGGGEGRDNSNDRWITTYI